MERSVRASYRCFPTFPQLWNHIFVHTIRKAHTPRKQRKQTHGNKRPHYPTVRIDSINSQHFPRFYFRNSTRTFEGIYLMQFLLFFVPIVPAFSHFPSTGVGVGRSRLKTRSLVVDKTYTSIHLCIPGYWMGVPPYFIYSHIPEEERFFSLGEFFIRFSGGMTKIWDEPCNFVRMGCKFSFGRVRLFFAICLRFNFDFYRCNDLVWRTIGYVR